MPVGLTIMPIESDSAMRVAQLFFIILLPGLVFFKIFVKINRNAERVSEDKHYLKLKEEEYYGYFKAGFTSS